jgi:hypothetical protein
LPISRRERAADHFQKTNDLAREAVGCNAGLGRSAWVLCYSDAVNGRSLTIR